jgi:hypothetical protein
MKEEKNFPKEPKETKPWVLWGWVVMMVLGTILALKIVLPSSGLL